MFLWESGSDALSRTKAEWLDLIFKVSCDADGVDRPWSTRSTVSRSDHCHQVRMVLNMKTHLVCEGLGSTTKIKKFSCLFRTRGVWVQDSSRPGHKACCLKLNERRTSTHFSYRTRCSDPNRGVREKSWSDSGSERRAFPNVTHLNWTRARLWRTVSPTHLSWVRTRSAGGF